MGSGTKQGEESPGTKQGVWTGVRVEGSLACTFQGHDTWMGKVTTRAERPWSVETVVPRCGTQRCLCKKLVRGFRDAREDPNCNHERVCTLEHGMKCSRVS
jgi:hypothetical protein